jgi:hypothetical protein
MKIVHLPLGGGKTFKAVEWLVEPGCSRRILIVPLTMMRVQIVDSYPELDLEGRIFTLHELKNGRLRGVKIYEIGIDELEPLLRIFFQECGVNAPITFATVT